MSTVILFSLLTMSCHPPRITLIGVTQLTAWLHKLSASNGPSYLWILVNSRHGNDRSE